MSYQSTWDNRRDAILAAANRVKDTNPGAWDEVKVPGQKSRRFISLVAAECQRTVSVDIGCNLKRGGPETSLDVLAMPNPSGCRDATGTYPGLELRDIIGGAEGPNPSIIWGDATQATIDSGNPGGWIKTATSQPGPQPPQSFPYPDEPTAVLAYEKRVEKSYHAVGRKFPDEADPDAFRHFARYGYSCSKMAEPEAANKHIKELRQELGAPPE